jgi:predicted nucleic acid-binding protein
MMYLVDANVLSEPTRPSPSSKVIDWLNANEELLVVDPIVLGELRIGILTLAPGRKRKQLEQWFAALTGTIECLPWDAAVGLRWARLVADLRVKGKTMPVLDSLVAAMALEHKLTLATHNLRHFSCAGVKLIDPFD